MTPDEYAAQFINENNIPIASDSKKYRALVSMIEQAVAAERERCAKIADKWDVPSDPRDDSEKAAHDIAAAIRASNGAK